MNIESIKIAVERKSGGKVIKVCEYDDDHYLFVVEGANPYYVTDKDGTNSISINPMEDFDTFFEALDNRVIKVW